MAATLDDVVKAIREGNEGTATQQAKAAEQANEQKVYDNQVLASLTSISDAIKGITPFKIKETDSKGFLGSILKSFGLIGAGAAGLAVGLVGGWTVFVADLVRDLGKLLMKFINAIPRPQFVDDIIAAFKADGKVGQFFTKIKNFFVGETGFVKRISTVVDTVVDAVKGFTGGIFTKISNFFVGETSVFKRIGTIVDTTVDAVKGFTGGIFTKIGNFFSKSSVLSKIGTTVDEVMDTLKAFGGGVFDGIKNVFTKLKSIGSTLMSPFEAISGVFGNVTDKGGGILDTIMKFINPFKGVFQTFARIGSKLAAPLSIIMGLFDAGFETKDAVEKSEGVFATLLNGLIGAIGGFIDGAVLQVADFLKDGIATVLGFFGFEETEKAMKAIRTQNC